MTQPIREDAKNDSMRRKLSNHGKKVDQELYFGQMQFTGKQKKEVCSNYYTNDIFI